MMSRRELPRFDRRPSVLPRACRCMQEMPAIEGLDGFQRDDVISTRADLLPPQFVTNMIRFKSKVGLTRCRTELSCGGMPSRIGAGWVV
jgi:hypothetical protein